MAEPVRRIRRVCVFCGSSRGRRAVYWHAAEELGRLLAARGIGIVYGGASVGMMGLLADGALAAGGEVIGVIPQALVDREVAHDRLTELRVVGSMHERKAVMSELSDAFIAMPGGVGTLEETFEVWTWAQLGLHAKPCGLFNVAGFYDRLADFLDGLVEEQFLKTEHREMLIVEPDAAGLLDALASYRPTAVPKWIRSGDAT